MPGTCCQMTWQSKVLDLRALVAGVLTAQWITYTNDIVIVANLRSQVRVNDAERCNVTIDQSNHE